MVRRIYVEKRPEFAVAARALQGEIQGYLGISSVTGVRILNRYDVEGVSQEVFEQAVRTVFSEPPVDLVYEESFPVKGGRSFTVEFLPGQFDQRADSAMQCVKLLDENEEPVIRTAVTYVIEGKITGKHLEQIKDNCVNPVDSKITDDRKPESLEFHYEEPEDVYVFEGFQTLSEQELSCLYETLGLAMTLADFTHIQRYFIEEHRDPTMTEIRVLDTYWSDHCRHTTFSTEFTEVELQQGDYREALEETYHQYLESRKEVYGDRKDKFVCLMDLALIAMKKLKKMGKLEDQEESDEINACSIVVPVEIDGKKEEWLVSFKNETHNHPTEIEPFGGAATCLGGAIRDPLSGRSYVYQAMRVTGAADPTVPVSETLKGKLPQKKIVQQAAHGYSSYGNQIGLATGYVKELYHPNYVAKRMEVGAVMGASPRRCVKRLTSDPGDRIILLGGRTGRDGCGGATGSSKIHTEESISTCGAEVQKGNPPTERKIQRLFRREEVSCLIKKCNDFGAGGVSVAIGELADGLEIQLDLVPKKYAGLDGTEIAISESQERMAVVVAPEDVDRFLNYAKEENLEAVEVAVVTKEPRLVLFWRGHKIVDLSRAFLDTNGAHQEAKASIKMPSREDSFFNLDTVDDPRETWLATLEDLNVCSQKGLVERFDSSIGAGSVLMPYGGKYQLTETQCMVAKLPVLSGHCDTATMMSYGFDPYLSSWSPYHGAIYAVLESISKIVAAGGDYKKIRFSFQEYFQRMTGDPERYGKPFAALLGAFDAQMGFELPSIGGKDSMSGTFNEIDVPPTLISFAVAVTNQQDVITPEFKKPGSKIVLFRIKKDSEDKPVYHQVKALYERIHDLIQKKVIISAYAIDGYGIAPAVSKMAFGNKLGVKLIDELSSQALFCAGFGNLVAEVPEKLVKEIGEDGIVIGEVTGLSKLCYQDMSIDLEEALENWSEPLESVFPTRSHDNKALVKTEVFRGEQVHICSHKLAVPKVFIPVFPGTNCEYDSARAFTKAGAEVTTRVFKNMSAQDIRESVEEFKKEIAKAQILMFPGGFSAGDEPDGSAKFFATAFRNQTLTEEVEKLLQERDGLVLGICNGFQALVKLGLVPKGTICPQMEGDPTLTYNTIGRHISKMVHTKVVSNLSPWLQLAELDHTYMVPASHGEGRFVASREWMTKLFENGQVATQYVNESGKPTMDEEWNVNGSYLAVEGITSPDGRVFGKMAHAERQGESVAKNITGDQDMKIFESGVAYFKL